MIEKENPYLNNGMPLNDSDLTKDASNAKSELFASLQFIKKVRALKKELEQKEGVETQNKNTSSNTMNFDNINSYINKNDAVNSVVDPVIPQENFSNSSNEIKDEYISYDYRNTPEQSQNFENFDMQDSDNNLVYSNDPTNVTPVDVNTQTFDNNQPEQNQQPTYVVNDKPQKTKGKKKTKEVKKENFASEDIKSGKKVAWLAYILFFIPLMFAGKNAFVRFHANEGLEINIIDVLGVGLFLTGYLVKVENAILSWILLGALALGIVLIILTTITKLFMIIFSLCGKTPKTPWLWNVRIIK